LKAKPKQKTNPDQSKSARIQTTQMHKQSRPNKTFSSTKQDTLLSSQTSRAPSLCHHWLGPGTDRPARRLHDPDSRPGHTGVLVQKVPTSGPGTRSDRILLPAAPWRQMEH